MDILHKRNISEFDYKIIDIIKILKFNKYKIDIKGSSSLKSQQYFSDYDFFCQIPDKIGGDEAYNTIINIVRKVGEQFGIYFIELKLQTLNNKKIRWYDADNIDKNKFVKYFNDVDFIKLDIVANIDNRLTEISVIYKFGENITVDYISGLKSDIKELKKEGKYYKVLKRMFNIYKAEGDKDKLVDLTKFFNSEYGQIYKRLSNLDAIKLVADNYDDNTTKKIIKYNLKELGNLSQLEKDRLRMNKVAKSVYSSII
jgi:hypothetical protein